VDVAMVAEAAEMTLETIADKAERNAMTALKTM
jgi:hypothetical protein